MTITTNTGGSTAGAAVPAPVDLVTLTIDGFEVSVPKGTLVIRAAELIGIEIPRFCDHPLLDPVGACRQCLVDVEGQRKPLISCATTVTEGMVVRTQNTSPMAEKAQRGIIEFLLINHPLDCPVCDKGGECPLQNQTMSNGDAETRFTGVKRTYPKPIAISSQVLLDRERCVLCARCTRFSAQIAGDPFIELMERGALEQVGIYEKEPFESYFSGNTVQICPVGALTGTAYRFRARPFDLVSTPTACEHCASGCTLRTDHRRGKVLRRLAGDEPEVNEEWNCDKGRWAFAYAAQRDRLATPLVRDEYGELVPASWPEALSIAAKGLAEASGASGVLVGGRLTVEDSYAYAKFARVALATNDVDLRARPHSVEELDFLATSVAGRFLETTYADLEAAPAVLLAGFEAEDESPIVFLRLRKAVRKNRLAVFSVAPFASRGLTKTSGRLLATVPGAEASVLDAIAAGGNSDETAAAAAAALRQPGAVILVGERLASAPGALSAAARLAEQTGAKLAWVPRRAGERGAIETGALPNLLPGGRLVTDAQGRAEVERQWATTVPATPGRSTAEIVEAARTGSLRALVVAGIDPDDLTDPAAALAALEAVPFLVSLELRPGAVTERADVVFPVAAAAEKAGTFLDWEGRQRPFDQALTETGRLADHEVLNGIADEMDVHLGLPNLALTRAEIAELGTSRSASAPQATSPAAVTAAAPGVGQAVLATWHHLLDEGRLQEGEPFLAGTARRAVARLSAATAAEIGASDGAPVTVSTDRGAVTLPLVVTDMPDRVVWVPTASIGSAVRRDLAADAGTIVRIAVGGSA